MDAIYTTPATTYTIHSDGTITSDFDYAGGIFIIIICVAVIFGIKFYQKNKALKNNNPKKTTQYSKAQQSSGVNTYSKKDKAEQNPKKEEYYDDEI